MNWQIRTVLAGVLAALGLYVIFNPTRVTTLVAGAIPWPCWRQARSTCLRWCCASGGGRSR